MTQRPTTIFHITTRQAWRDAQSAGTYVAPSLRSEGFIHASRADQVLQVANGAFRGRVDLVLLCIDAAMVDAEIRYENLTGGPDLFPHIYGPLDIDAVTAVVAFGINADGELTLPPRVLSPR